MEGILIKKLDGSASVAGEGSAFDSAQYTGNGQSVQIVCEETGADITIKSLNEKLQLYTRWYIEATDPDEKGSYAKEIADTIDKLESVKDYYFPKVIRIVDGYCMCSCGDVCPNGRTGSQNRCSKHEIEHIEGVKLEKG